MAIQKRDNLLAALVEVPAVVAKKLIFFRRVWALQDAVAVWKTTEPFNDVGAQFSKMRDGLKCFAMRR